LYNIRALDNPQKLKIVAYWELTHTADNSGMGLVILGADTQRRGFRYVAGHARS
jgi:murein endopeptidase